MEGIGSVGDIDPSFNTGKKKEAEKSFREIFKPFIDDVSKKQEVADNTYLEYLKGNASIDEVVVTFRKAQLSFELLLQIRNKLMDAYEELMRLRV